MPTEEAARIALRTQQIIAYESGTAQTVDPCAGSYYIEYLTDELEKRAESYLEKIEILGGTIKAIEHGYIQSEIQNAAYEYQRSVDAGQAIVVGANSFAIEEEKSVPILRIDESLEGRQVERLRALRSRRDPKAWRTALMLVEDAARDGSNLMPQIIHAVESYCTVGEIASRLRSVFGEYKEEVSV